MKSWSENETKKLFTLYENLGIYSQRPRAHSKDSRVVFSGIQRQIDSVDELHKWKWAASTEPTTKHE